MVVRFVPSHDLLADIADAAVTTKTAGRNQNKSSGLGNLKATSTLQAHFIAAYFDSDSQDYAIRPGNQNEVDVTIEMISDHNATSGQQYAAKHFPCRCCQI